MNQTLANLYSLGECDPELAEKIQLDIEAVLRRHLELHSFEIAESLVRNQQANIEKIALRALKNHLNGTIYQ